MLRAAIISDLHLGSTASRPRDVLRFLKSLDAQTLVINGDLLDSFPTKTLSQEEWEVLYELRDIEEGSPTKVYYLRGNHDSTANTVASLLGLSLEDSHLLEVGGKRIYICHGHTWDPSYIEGKYSFWTSLGNFFESLVGIFSLKAEIWWRRKRRDFFRCDNDLWNGAHSEEMRKYDIVICGHTHWPVDSSFYINGGSWCQDRINYVSVSQEGEVKLEVFE